MGLLARDNFKWTHHVIVFMFQHMTVMDITTRIAVSSNQNGKYVPRTHNCRILPSGFIRGGRPRNADQLQSSLNHGPEIKSLTF